MCDKADNSLAALKLIPDCFFTSKMIKKLKNTKIKKLEIQLYTQMKIYSTLIKILSMLYLVVMEWVFSIWILIILILIIILMKMILMLLFLSDFWLGILNLNNAKSLEK